MTVQIKPLVGALALCGVVSAAQASVTQEMLDQAGSKTEWLHPNGSYAQMRYFPGSQINSRNVKNLRPAFVFQTDLINTLQGAPLVHDGVMYVSTSFDHVYAVDAVTGKELWHYQQKLGDELNPCCGPGNKGLAVSGDTLYMGTLDAKLVALDAKTGKLKWETQIADPAKGYSETMAPAVVDGKVLIGTGGGEYGVRGFLKAFDAETGKLLWTFFTIPDTGSEGVWATHDVTGNDLHRDIAAEKAQFAKQPANIERLGGPVWATPAVDRATRTVFFTVGNPSPDYDDSQRPGDNLYTNSLVAVDLDTGKYKWHFQYTPHDVWDRDPASPPVLVDVKDAHGKIVPGVMQAGKIGILYVHDRRDGHLLRYSEVLVPQENAWGKPTTQGVTIQPGPAGGVEWSPISASPKLHYAFVPTIYQPMNIVLQPAPYPNGKLWFTGSMSVPHPEKRYGTVTAVDYNTGKIAWQTKTALPMIGGTLATAGNLVFAGEGNGLFKAFDAKTGKLLWQFQCGAGVNAPPMAYTVNGKEYIAVEAGGNTIFHYKKGNSVFVFELPKK